MQVSEYQKLAMRTNDGLCSDRLRQSITLGTAYIDKGNYVNTGEVINAALGLSGEVGELNDILKKNIFHGHGINFNEVKKKLGDICWYIALMCDGFGFDLDEIMQLNIDKLKKRYPDGFSEQASISREI